MTDSPAKVGFPTHFASDMFNERRWTNASATSTPTASASQSRATTPHGASNMATAGSSSVSQFEDTSDSSSRKRGIQLNTCTFIVKVFMSIMVAFRFCAIPTRTTECRTRVFT
jgi:hypothetical protein